MKPAFVLPLLVAAILSAPRTAPAADVAFYAIFKTQNFVQDNDLAPRLAGHSGGSDGSFGDQPFSLEVVVLGTGASTITSGTLTKPDSSTATLSAGDDGVFYEEQSDEKPEFDAANPPGTYQLEINTVNEGTRMFSLNLPEEENYPNIPRIQNISQMQNLDPSMDLVLNWDAFVGGIADDYIRIEISQQGSDDSVFESEDPGQPMALDGTDTMLTIPGSTLDSGMDYDVTVSFFKRVDFVAGPPTGFAAYTKTTRFEIRTMGGTDTQPPFLSSSSPSPGTSNVKDISLVSFGFSKPMDTSVDLSQAIQWSGVADPAMFDYSWSADGTTLFCQYTPTLPLNATISWTLNPNLSPLGAAAGVTRFQDLAGNELQDTPLSGEFSTASNSNATEPDVLSLEIVKGQGFFQEADNTADPAEIWFFEMDAELNGFNTVPSATLTVPGVGTFDLLPASHGDEIEAEVEYASKSDLDTFAPNGTYAVQFDTIHDGMKTISLDLSTDSYPNAPAVVNYTAAQSIDTTQSFTLTWNAMNSPGANDFVLLLIENSFSREIIEEILPGNTTQYTFDAGSLPPGRELEVELIFARGVDLDDSFYPGVTGRALFASVTSLSMQTAGTPIVPSLELFYIPGAPFTVRLHGEYNAPYTIEGVPNLGDQWASDFFGWSDQSQSGNMGSFDFQDPNALLLNRRFYRAVEGFSFSDPGGGDQSFTLSFLHFVNGGTMESTTATTYAAPVSMGGYAINAFSPAMTVSGDDNPPDASLVLFTGPGGSGVSNEPADSGNSNVSPGSATYQTSHISSPPTAIGGTWSVDYNSFGIDFEQTDPDANNRLVIPHPTVMVDAEGEIASVEWQYLAAGDGTPLTPTQAISQSGMIDIQVQINRFSAAGYNSQQFGAMGTFDDGMAASNIPWSEVSAVHMAYNDNIGNHYVISYQANQTD